MEEKITFTNEELSAIVNYLDGKVDLKGCNEEQQKIYSAILDKVDYLEEKLNANDERMQTDACDGILWLYNRYLKQNGKETVTKKNTEFLY